MAEWQEKLPPITRERLARVGETTPEEKQRMKDYEWLDSLISEFYKGQLDPEGLWKRLKEYGHVGKGHLLKEAQTKLMDSLSLGSAAAEFQQRRDGLLAMKCSFPKQNLRVTKKRFKRYFTKG